MRDIPTRRAIYGQNGAATSDRVGFRARRLRSMVPEQEYQEATDTKPYRNLLGMALRSLAEAILAEQEVLKTSKKTLPAWGLAFLSLSPEQMALITIGTLFNLLMRKFK